jgi:hypothetical protein
MTLADWAATNWVAAMMGLGLFAAAHAIAAPGAGFRALRCWVALLAASLAGWLVTPATGQIPIVQYIAIDFAAAVLVLWNPARIEQRRIALLFAAMIASHIGLAAYRLAWAEIGWGALVPAAHAHFMLNAYLGWLQLALLALWSGGDVGRFMRNHLWGRRAGHHHPLGAPRA